MYDVIIIGAGPSGLMAASTIKNKKVLLIDKNDTIGKKLLITGGTRCNVLNLKEPNDFIKNLPNKNGKFLYHTLNTFSPKDIYKFIEEKGVPLKVEDHDRVFPRSNKSIDFINMFNSILNDNKIDIKLNEEVTDIEVYEDYKEVTTNKNSYKTKNIIISTGGVTYTNTGSTGDGLKFSKKLGHNITDLYPSSTPLLSNDEVITSTRLQGVTLEDITLSLKVNNKVIKEIKDNLLFTHFGLSGPSALKISEFVYNNLDNNPIILINSLNSTKENIINYIKKEKENNPNIKINTLYKGILINRYYEYILDSLSINNKPLQELSNKNIELLASYLTEFEIKVIGTKPMNTAFVTGGGVNIKEVNSKTMESKLIPGLYFTGEVLDLHGFTGGYNITIALSTGYIAGSSINEGGIYETLNETK